MEASFYLSAGAVLISLISFVWAIHVGNRDRAKLKATSTFYEPESPEDGVPYLEVKVMNYGRRPVILTGIGAKYLSSESAWISLEKKAVRLGENDKFEIFINAGDCYTVDPLDGKKAIDLWFEDTLGRRYKIKSVKKHLKRLWTKTKKN